MKVRLFSTEGSSDKEYSLFVEKVEGGYDALYQYGPRGGTQRQGKLNKEPVPYEEAVALYEQRLLRQERKGYVKADDQGLQAYESLGKEDSGYRPMLAVSVEGEGDYLDLARPYLDSPDWWMQRKYDGNRLMLKKSGQDVTGINRKGQTVPIPGTFVVSAREIAHDFVLDGEQLGEAFMAFDILELNGEDLRPKRFNVRWGELYLLNLRGSLRTAPTWVHTHNKEAFLQVAKASNWEGVIFRSVYGIYKAGRNKDLLRLKFFATAEAYVLEQNDQRSIKVGLVNQLDPEVWDDLGNVTIPGNVEVPEAGCVVQIRYLYVKHEGGKFYQPIYEGVRPDKDPKECTWDDIQFRG